MAPSDAQNPASNQHVHNALYVVDDKVRITRMKGTFEKGFTPDWTDTIKDTLGEPVQGTFYEQEPQLSIQEIFRIERVLRKRKNQVYVKWKGYSNAFNSWIPLTDLGA